MEQDDEMKILDFVRNAWNDFTISDEDAKNYLWSLTGFPSFYLKNPTREFYYQLQHAKRSLKRGFSAESILFTFAGGLIVFIPLSIIFLPYNYDKHHVETSFVVVDKFENGRSGKSIKLNKFQKFKVTKTIYENIFRTDTTVYELVESKEENVLATLKATVKMESTFKPKSKLLKKEGE
jgi:hypothetical protein